MRAEETRARLITELEAQFSKIDASSGVQHVSEESIASSVIQYASEESVVNSVMQYAPEEPVVTFPSPTFEKPKLFMPKEVGRLTLQFEEDIPAVKGIGFKDATVEEATLNTLENYEIYSMKELIEKNPENMKTYSYDENVVRTQLALVKKRDWQDILFEDIDWFKNVDLIAGIKRLFSRFYK